MVEQEAKDPKIDPPSKSVDFESNFTDAKFKVRAARGQGKKKRRRKSTHGATRGPRWLLESHHIEMDE